jgi:protein ImuB
MGRCSLVRLACVDVPELPLQLLLKRHPEWREYPAVVVSRDSPGGTILNVNARARKESIVPGLRYAAGLSLAPTLRAGTVPHWEVVEGARGVLRRLHRFSPQVEPCPEPGLFWLDAAGLVPLYDSLEQWVACIQGELGAEGLAAAVAVGFSRFGCYAAAKTAALAAAETGSEAGSEAGAAPGMGAPAKIFASPGVEREAALQAPLAVLALEPSVLDRLEMLGIRKVGEFLKLPTGGVRRRFGPETEHLHRFASGVLTDGAAELPLQPQYPEQPAAYTVRLPVPSSETLRLLDAAARCLDSLLRATEARQDMVRELYLLLKTEEEASKSETLTPAVPTRDRRLLLELIALRLEALRLPGPAAAVTLSGAYTRETIAQRELFVQRSAEARAAVAQAFARLRAVFGNQAVQLACLEDEHLPERSYRWESLERLPDPAFPGASRGRKAAQSPGAPQSPAVSSAPASPPPDARRTPPAPLSSAAPQPPPAPQSARLVRRVYRSPKPLPDSPALERLRSNHAAPSDRVRSDPYPARDRLPSFRRLWGPYLLSGHWWEWEVSREYYYAEDAAGALLWLYRDRHTRRWWIAGRVE